MKTTIVFLFLLAPGLSFGAQQAGENAPAQTGGAARAQAKNSKQLIAAADDKKRESAAPKKEQAKSDEDEEADEGGVLIDTRAGEEAPEPEYAEPRPPAGPEEPGIQRGMPASYGQLKGAFSDGARNILVFENDEGVIAFVQVSVGRNSVGWKLVSRLPRSAD